MEGKKEREWAALWYKKQAAVTHFNDLCFYTAKKGGGGEVRGKEERRGGGGEGGGICGHH